MQAQQNAAQEQTLTNKVELLLQELSRPGISKTEALDRTYRKAGCVASKDGSMVFPPVHWFKGSWI